MADVFTEDDIRTVVDRFYDRVRADEELRQAFAVVQDWNEHLGRMVEFWSSVMLTTGRYKGNPVAMHLMHSDRIQPSMFVRWLALWAEATAEVLPEAAANLMQAKAARIASRLSMALFGHDISDPEEGADDGVALRPYKTTSVFDERSLPKPLLQAHALRAGTWGVLRVLEGDVKYRSEMAAPVLVSAANPMVIPPERPHHLELAGPVKCRIEFYDRDPASQH
ncbi:DUF1971 domain-containing protein [Rhizobium sp. Root1220]|uniref:DUF1971 domain-containing protein n=1 Tax=Rhizobium sp. Root1220 TaxID=1736432 RepID=UPI000A7A121F|nr:DUF1971 domain-containing protein [Rhizobium sp. Root1220]